MEKATLRWPEHVTNIYKMCAYLIAIVFTEMSNTKWYEMGCKKMIFDVYTTWGSQQRTENSDS